MRIEKKKSIELEPIEINLKQRKNDRIGQFSSTTQLPLNKNSINEIAVAKNILATSAVDFGVWRNGGRQGTRYAPQSILYQLKNFNISSTWNQKEKQKSILVIPLLSHKDEENNFKKAQEKEQHLWSNIFKNFKGRDIFHLGGGHDHIYPMLAALSEEKFKQIFILNIDAHLDTRTDTIFHSGTPFRQMDELNTKVKFTLVQYGIQDFANSISTSEKLKSICKVVRYQEILKSTDFFRKSPKQILKNIFPTKVGPDCVGIFSLDCDGISSSVMEGVSAVNPQGLPPTHVQEIQQIFNKHFQKAGLRIFGYYEYNPIYDQLNCKGSKWIAAQIYSILNNNL